MVGYEGLWWVMRGYGRRLIMVGYEGLWWVMRGYGGL